MTPPLHFEPLKPPLLLGLSRMHAQFLPAQRQAEHQLLAACWIGESAERGFTARLLAGFDLGLCADLGVKRVLASWTHCPLESLERRCTWLWAILFGHGLLDTAIRYLGSTWPCEAGRLLERIRHLHAGRLAVEALGTWVDSPLAQVGPGMNVYLTSSGNLAAAMTTGATVGLQLDHETDREWVMGALLTARPELVIIENDLPDADLIVKEFRAAGLKTYLYEENNQ